MSQGTGRRPGEIKTASREKPEWRVPDRALLQLLGKQPHDAFDALDIRLHAAWTKSAAGMLMTLPEGTSK